jgi:hypothetical protein
MVIHGKSCALYLGGSRCDCPANDEDSPPSGAHAEKKEGWTVRKYDPEFDDRPAPRLSGAHAQLTGDDPPLESTLASSLIVNECDAIKAMLLEKNAAYGNSALNPLRVFSKADSAEQIKVRIDDKLSRLARGSAAGEDTIADLIGYLILLRIATR